MKEEAEIDRQILSPLNTYKAKKANMTTRASPRRPELSKILKDEATFPIISVGSSIDFQDAKESPSVGDLKPTFPNSAEFLMHS